MSSFQLHKKTNFARMVVSTSSDLQTIVSRLWSLFAQLYFWSVDIHFTSWSVLVNRTLPLLLLLFSRQRLTTNIISIGPPFVIVTAEILNLPRKQNKSNVMTTVLSTVKQTLCKLPYLPPPNMNLYTLQMCKFRIVKFIAIYYSSAYGKY